MTDAELAQLQRDVQILKDIEAVKKVKHAFLRCIDTANLAELTELLHPKVHAKLVGGTYAIEFNDRADYIEMVANSFNAEFVGMHHGHHPEIEILSETEATGTWYLQDIAMDFRRKVTTTGSSIYHDQKLHEDRRQVADHRYALLPRLRMRRRHARTPTSDRSLPGRARPQREITFTVVDKYNKQ